MWKIGQKLVCVNNTKMDSYPLILNEIYTYDGADPSVDGFIFLSEVINTVKSGRYFGERISFRATCFRPVDETFGEEVAEKIEKEFINQPEPQLV